MIGYYVHHHGQGHITRACQVAQHLESPVTGFSTLPRPASWTGQWVQLPGDETPSPQDPTAGGVLHWAPLHHPGHAGRMAVLSQHMAGLDLMLVDVSAEVSLLARLHGVPVVVLAMRGDRSDRPHQMAWDCATSLLVPWGSEFPEPQWPEHWTRKAHFVGAVSRFDDRRPEPTPRADGRRHVLVLLGGGGHDLEDDALHDAATHAPEWEWTLRSAQSPSPDLWAELQAADVIVCHGGNNVVAEVAAARRPAVVVAQDRPFREQHHTAAALERAGICVGLGAWPEPQDWPDLLALAVVRGTSGWRQWNHLDGAQRAAGHLDRLATDRVSAS